MNDGILREIRATREAFARAHDYDSRAMVAALRRLHADADRPLVRLTPRTPIEPTAACSGRRLN